ncbi:S1C family serine protease, partial [Propionibacterium freudenreichii]
GGWGPAPQPPRRRRGPLLLVIGLALVVFTGALFGSIGVLLRPTMPGLAPPASGAASWGNYTPFMPNASPNDPGATVRPTAPSAEQTDASGDQIRGVAIVEAMLSVTEGSAGTGMVIGDSGIVLTNYHVVQGTNGTINVTIASTGSTYSAKVLGHDKANDVALLSLNGASGLPTVKIDADGVRAGDQVTSVGNTDGRRKIMAAPGEVLSTNESILTRDEGSTATNQLSGVYETSSRAMHGDSGGPTYDSQTEVIGLTTAGSADDGSQFATAYVVPIARALDIANKISRNEPSGTVQMGP